MEGLPIGNLTSQFAANVYLNGVDNFMARQLRPQGYLRYMCSKHPKLQSKILRIVNSTIARKIKSNVASKTGINPKQLHWLASPIGRRNESSKEASKNPLKSLLILPVPCKEVGIVVFSRPMRDLGGVLKCCGLVFSFGVLSSLSFAKVRQIPIKGAYCGNGDPYSVLVRDGDPNKILLYFEGGGLCWDEKSCFSFPKMAKTEWTGGQKREGVLSEDLSENPLRSDTLIQFPYCTADLYVGTHRVNYKSHSLNHLGRKNLERAFAVLEAEGLLTGRVKRFLAYGRSAGALGLLLNMDLLNAYIDGEAQKVVIIDAPGAQFAPKVWEQFDDLFFRDIRSAFFRNGSDIERGETKLSSKFQEICQTYPHWRMGFLQGSRDTVMSLLFGKILPYQFEEQVLSEVGLFGLLQDPNDECSSWTPRSRTHGFLSRLQGLHKRTEDRLSALEYLDQLLDPEALQRSHR